jgi:sugar phosphate isomerase/epimerase/HEAT repeat protein
MTRLAFFFLATGFLLGPRLAAQFPEEPVRAAVTKLASASAAELGAWCDRLVEPEKRPGADDTEARMVLHGLSMRAGATPELRANLLAAYAKVLAADRPKSIKSFVLEQMQFSADAASLPGLAALLRDPELCDPACRVAVGVGGEAAASLLRTALAGSEGSVRLTLVQALGVLRDAASVPALLQDAVSPQRELRLAALRALGASGDARAAQVLLAATRDASRYNRAQADEAYLEFLVRQVAVGQAEAAVTQAAAYAASRPEEAHLQAAVMEIYAQAATDTAVDAVLAGMLSDRDRVRQSAGLTLRRLPAERSAAKLATRLETTPVERRPGLLLVLAELKASGALPAVRSQITATDTATRQAAILALGAIGGAEALPELVALLGDPREGVPAAAADALAGLSAAGVGARLLELAPAAPPPVRVALLGLLARRLDLAQATAAFAFLTDPAAEVRLATWRALETLTAAEHLPRLLEAVLSSAEAKEQKAGAAAFAAASRRVAKPELTGPLLAAALGKADAAHQIVLLAAAPASGGETALKAAVKEVANPDPAVRQAAVRALADWPDATAMSALLDIVRNAKEELPYVLAFRGYLRLLGAADQPAAALLPQYQEAMKLARRVDERRLVLTGIGRLKDRSAFALLLPYLQDADLQAEAANGIIQIAKDSGGDDSASALRKVLAAIKDEKLTQRAKETLSEVAKYAGCVITWEISGPYTDNDKGLGELHPIAFPPETDPAKATWRRVAAEADGRLDLNREFRGNNRCAYMRCLVQTTAAVDAVLAVGSDDGIKVWLNAAVVHDKNVPRPFVWCEDAIPVKLLKGPNRLLLKVTQGGGDWMGSARFRAADGTPLDGLILEVGGDWTAVGTAGAAPAPAVPAPAPAAPAPAPAALPLAPPKLASGAPTAAQLGWQMSIQCWSFNKATFFESVERAALMGVKVLEMFPGQRVDSEHADWKTDPSMPAAALAAVQAKLKAADIRVANFGVTGIPGDNPGRRKLFDWARTLGIETLCAEAEPAALPELDKLCQEYGINLALHNHPEPSRYWNPQTVLAACQGLSPRLGACADTGHWMRSGVTPMDAINLLQWRIITFHFKDLNEMGKGAHDVPWGTGKGDIPALLRRLRQQGFRGVFSAEYEYNWEKNTEDIAACVRNFEAMARELVLEEDGAWRVLFNMRDLAAWQNAGGQPPAASWRIEDECLALRGQGGDIWTRERFGDFVLDLEYDTTGNSGLFFRTDNPKDPVQTGLEMQVDKAETAGIHGVGALYDLLAPAAQAARPGWNHVTLGVKGSLVVIVLNDQPIVQADLESWTTPAQNPDGAKNKFKTALRDFKREGHIGFQDHGAAVRYRNLRIRRLQSVGAAATLAGSPDAPSASR